MAGIPINKMGLNKFDWQKLIIGEHKNFVGPKLPATTRLVLLTLSVWMRGPKDGEYIGEGKNKRVSFRCFPSTRRITDNTGLSERCVCEHLNKAAESGWIIRHYRERSSGKAWRRNEYIPSVPGSTKGADGVSVRDIFY